MTLDPQPSGELRRARRYILSGEGQPRLNPSVGVGSCCLAPFT
jgi:hypothetical protein